MLPGRRRRVGRDVVHWCCRRLGRLSRGLFAGWRRPGYRSGRVLVMTRLFDRTLRNRFNSTNGRRVCLHQVVADVCGRILSRRRRGAFGRAARQRYVLSFD
jgi:hypothetical protein